MTSSAQRAEALYRTISDVRFGVEVEHGGMTRSDFAEHMHKALWGDVADAVARVRNEGGSYDAWTVLDPQGRKWSVMSDGSVNGMGEEPCELVTPPLRLADMDILQRVLRFVRDAGARVDSSCGIHVHVDAAGLDGKALRSLVRLVGRSEKLIVGALAVQPQRLTRFCRGTDTEKVRRFDRVTTRDEAALAWYQDGEGSAGRRQSARYDSSRYCGLNLHSVFNKGTVEFRWFEAHHEWAHKARGTVHAGRVRAYVLLALLLRARALSAKVTSAVPVTGVVDKFNVNRFLLSLGAYGENFEILRTHLVRHLPGMTAWAGGRPTLAWLQRHAPHRIPEFYGPQGRPIGEAASPAAAALSAAAARMSSPRTRVVGRGVFSIGTIT